MFAFVSSTVAPVVAENLHSSEVVAAVEGPGFLSNQIVVWQVET
jgi:hypothetical protein